MDDESMNSDAPSIRGILAKLFRRRTLAVLAALASGTGLALGCWLALRSRGDSRASGDRARSPLAVAPDNIADEWLPNPGFVGSQACRNCHLEQFDSFLETPHSRALSEVVPDDEPPDAVFDHAATAHRYRVSRQSGRLVHESVLLLNDGTEWESTGFPVRYRLGSGHVGRTYLAEDGGFFVQSPITWYAGRKEWGLSLGYDEGGLKSFERVVPADCLFCHAGYFESSAASDRRVRLVEHSIGCERCHGPGKSHVDRETTGSALEQSGDHLIVNPRRLSRKESEAICHQCHRQGDLRVRARGASPEDYRAGQALEDYRHDYVVRKTGDKAQTVRHVEQLEQSACYRDSRTLKCATCHDPHAAVAIEDRPEHYRSICLSCHESRPCRLPLAERVASSQDRCTVCHMPRGATEMAHLAFTHHQIGVHPLPDRPAPGDDDQLVPLFDLAQLSEGDRQRSLGLAWQQRSTDPAEDAAAVPLRRKAAARAEDLLKTLPAEFVDGAVEMALADLYFDQGELSRAQAQAQNALARSNLTTDERVKAHEMLAGMDFVRQRFSEAADHFVELTQLRRYAGDWFNLGICESRRGNIAEGIRALENARTLDPEQIETYEKLAVMHHARKDRDAEKRVQDEIDRFTKRTRRPR
jgi:predicted CXXCH cytochrome family protein